MKDLGGTETDKTVTFEIELIPLKSLRHMTAVRQIFGEPKINEHGTELYRATVAQLKFEQCNDRLLFISYANHRLSIPLSALAAWSIQMVEATPDKTDK